MTLKCRNVYDHLRSSKHRENTTESDLSKLDTLLNILNNEHNSERAKLDEKAKKEDYLRFIGYLMSLGLSFSQISSVGNFLKNSLKKNRYSFLKEITFDEKAISK
jgi:hypothetical protein